MSLHTIERHGIPLEGYPGIMLEVGEGYQILDVHLAPESSPSHFNVFIKRRIGSKPKTITLRITCEGFVFDDKLLRHVKTLTDLNMFWHVFEVLQP